MSAFFKGEAMNYKGVIFLFFVLASIISASAGVLTVKGVYQGKNLFVQNPYSNNEFCTVSVFVNNKKVLSYPKVSAYEIDLSHLTMNTAITVKILHRNNCLPKVLNVQVIKSSSRFAFTSLNVDADALNWSTKGERAGGEYVLQRLNASSLWEDLEEIKGKESPSANYYTKRADHNTGLNQYRLKFIEKSGLIFYSKAVTFKLVRTPIAIYPRRVSDVLNFVSEKPVRYTIYDKNGSKMKEGKAITIDCTELPGDDHYTIVFDNQKKSFYKKN